MSDEAKFAEGGVIRGPGTGTNDAVPYMLSPGYVIPARIARQSDEQPSVGVPGRGDRPEGTQPREWVLDFGESKPLTLNGSRRNHFAHAAIVRSLRHEAILRCRIEGIPALARVAIELHYAPRDKRRRDPFNLVATLKPIEDGIVDAGVIPDDTPEFSVPTVPVIDAPTGKPGRVYVIVREVKP